MVKLTKFYGDEGLTLDKNLVFQGKGKTTDDLLQELNNYGLDVAYLDTSGELVRVPVRAGTIARPDKHGEKSGWYAVKFLGEHIFCAYGNWRDGSEQKWSSIEPNKLTTKQKTNLQKELKQAKEEAEKHKKERYKEVALDCRARFDSYEKVGEHQYLSSKKIKNPTLKTKSQSLVVPIYNILGELRSLQYILPDGKKRFVSASEVSGNFFPIGFDIEDIANLKKIYVTEGLATGQTVNDATDSPTICVFSANFGLKTLAQIRKKTQASLIVCFDNDKSGVGRDKANEIAKAIDKCVVKIPSCPGDFNDLALDQGIEQVKAELSNGGLRLTDYSVRNLVSEPPPRVFLVDRLIEKGKPIILSAIGGVGKSMLALDLGLKIIKGKGFWLDNAIKRSGNVVYLSAEDDSIEINRRINALDPNLERLSSAYDMYVYPIPDRGSPLTLLREDSSGLHTTEQAEELMQELEKITDLELVVIDPIQAFVNAPITTSQEASQMYGQFAATISSRFNCCCLNIHHMNKTSLVGTDDPMVARASIRGSSALVDSMRGAIAIWLAPESEAERICLDQGVDFDRMRVVKCGVVKANSSEIDTKIKTLFRKNVILEPIQEEEIKWE